ncbi:hypothetical protein WIX39_030040 [Variovorax sp. AB1(2024)]|uniref:hypothetical protein n=1 Tax=Variovorax sp. AB1(2024) TaxID=3132214 RepID=UPI00309FC5C7
MRHLETRQQPLQQQQAQPRTQHSGGTPASATAPRIDDTLDQAAALWTTRRIRSCLVLLDPSARPAHR